MTENFRDYANLTKDQRQAIIDQYHAWRSLGCPPDQCIAIAAHDGLKLTKRQMGGKTGANAFAAACAVLIMAKVIDVRCPAEGVIA